MDYHDENDFLHSLLSFNLKLLKNFAAAGRVVKFLSWKFKIMHTFIKSDTMKPKLIVSNLMIPDFPHNIKIRLA